MAITQEEIEALVERFRGTRRTQVDFDKILFEVSQRVLDELKLHPKAREEMNKLDGHARRVNAALFKRSMKGSVVLEPREATRILSDHLHFTKDVGRDLQHKGELSAQEWRYFRDSFGRLARFARDVRKENAPVSIARGMLGEMRRVVAHKEKMVMGPRFGNYELLNGHAMSLLERAGLTFPRRGRCR
jgi:hypothetical protein